MGFLLVVQEIRPHPLIFVYCDAIFEWSASSTLFYFVESDIINTIILSFKKAGVDYGKDRASRLSGSSS